MSETTIRDIVRADDNQAAHDGAHKAVNARAHHKQVALAILYGSLRPMSAQDVRDRALRLGLVATVSSAESVRRRVLELVKDGLATVVDERGPTGATYGLSHEGLDDGRVAARSFGL